MANKYLAALAKDQAQAKTAKATIPIMSLKGSPEYKQWLSSMTSKTHIASTVIVRLALAEWAAKNGHQAPPEM